MFFATHPYAEYHAVLRTFSDAPLYITDRQDPDPNILNKLGGKNTRGGYRIVKAGNGRSVRLPGTVFDDVLGHGKGKALKMALPVDDIAAVHVGVWNCRAGDARTADVLTWRDLGEALSLLKGGKEDVSAPDRYVLIEGADETGEHLVLSSQDIMEASGSLNAPSKPIAALRLDSGACKVFTFSPVLDFDTAQIAVFGLVDKYAGLCAVKSVKEVRVTETALDRVKVGEDTEPAASQEARLTAAAEPVSKGADEGASDARAETESSSPLPTIADERTPLLRRHGSLPPSETTRASALLQRRSRMCALLFFWRADLAKLRTSFFRDFVGSPFVTMYKEVRAMLGGRPTNPDRSAAEGNGSSYDASPEVSPPVMTQVGADRILPSFVEATRYQGAETREGGGARDMSEQASEHEETADIIESDSDSRRHQRIVIETTVAGKLAFILFGEDPAAFRFTLQDMPISKEHITCKGERITIDMQGALTGLGQETGKQGRATFLVGVERA